MLLSSGFIFHSNKSMDYSQTLDSSLRLKSINNPELLAYFSMDEGSGSVVVDDSGNGNTGTIFGADWIEGKLGTALSFDGDYDYVKVDGLSFNTGELSVSAWVYYYNNDEFSNTWSNAIIAQDDDVGGDQRGTRVFQLSTFYDNFCWLGFHQRDLLSDDSIDIQRWYHVAATFNGNYHSFYVDGVLNDVEQGAITFDESVPINIGSKNDQELFFLGIIDEVKIFNNALTAEEVLLDYQGNLIQVTTSIIDPGTNSDLENEYALYTGVLLIADICLVILIIRKRKK